MELKNYFAQDSEGNILPAAEATVFLAGTGTLATIFKADGSALSNPFSTAGDGLLQFAAANGQYDLRVTTPGRTYTLRIQCNDVAGNILKTEGSADNGASLISWLTGGVKKTVGSWIDDILVGLGQRIKQIDTYADAASHVSTSGRIVYVAGRTAAGDGGGGSNWLDTKGTVGRPAANGGTIIHTSDGWLERQRPPGYVRAEWFADIGGGGADDAPAFNAAAALGGEIHVGKPAVAFLLSSPIDLTVDGTKIIGVGMYTSVFRKGFNGEAIKLTGNGTKIAGIGIDGQGATRTGGGIKIIGYNCVAEYCRIVDTDDCPVLFDPAVGSNALAGTYALVNGCFLLPRNTSTTYASRCTGVDDATRPTARVFRNISGGGPLIDFSGMNRASLIDSFGTLIKFSASSGKINIQGNRFTNAAANITILGSDHTIDNNNWGFGVGFNVTIDASCANVSWGQNNNIVQGSSTISPPVIGSAIGGGMPNTLTTPLISYSASFAWFGSTSNGVLGNSTYSAYYSLTARKCCASFSLIRGSSATNPVGTFWFPLPFKANVTATGHALVKSSGTAVYYSAVCEVQGGSDKLYIYLNGAAGAMNDASIGFGTNALIEATINYVVSAS